MSAVTPETQPVTSVDDLVAAIHSAIDEKITVSAGRSSSATRRLDLAKMNQVVDYPARDMTVTVQAGMTVRTLTDLLREENQQLPVDCPDPEMSVGAFVAFNGAGSRQYGYGTLRDYLIGVEAVDGQGRVFHAGGRVVKNVAGYDLCRLMIGSRGRLGILSQLTFKLKPHTPHEAVARFAWSKPTGVAAALDQLNTSTTRPNLIDLETAPEEPWVIAVGVGGTAAACEWELVQIRRELRDCDKMHVLIQEHEACTTYRNDTAAAHLPKSGRMMIHTLPSRVVDVAGLLRDHGSHVIAHAGNGILLATVPDSVSFEDLTREVSAHVTDCGGSVQLSNAAPAALTDQEQRIIAAFDPHGLFQDA